MNSAVYNCGRCFVEKWKGQRRAVIAWAPGRADFSLEKGGGALSFV